MSENKNISVIGEGRLGLSFSLLADSVGYNVLGLEINQERKEQIANKTLKTSEPQIQELLSKSNLKLANSTKEIVNHSDLIFIFVATPSLVSGEYDHSQINNVISSLEEANCVDSTVVINCTVMPQYCESLQRRVKGLGINVVYNPLLIAQGSICKDIKNADLILLGGKIPDKLYQIYKDIMVKEPNFRNTSLTATEITKIGINCALTAKISFANCLGEIAINSGVEEEVEYILESVGNDSRIGNKYLKYGFGYGGTCLVRDERALGIHATKVGLTDSFQKEIDNVNDRHLLFQKDYYIKKNPNKEFPFIFSYLTFKPSCDIFTESQPLKLALEFLKEGYSIYVWRLPESKLEYPKEIKEYEEKGQVKYFAYHSHLIPMNYKMCVIS